MPVQSTTVEILAAVHLLCNGFSRFGQTYANRPLTRNPALRLVETQGDKWNISGDTSKVLDSFCTRPDTDLTTTSVDMC